MSSAARPEFFVDRSLGRSAAENLRGAGYVVHLLRDIYPDDARDIPDEQWIAEGCSRGWVLLTKDKRIRYRTQELGALSGHLFCLSNSSLTVEQMSAVLLAAAPKIGGAIRGLDVGFWHVYPEGRLRKMWPES